MKFGVPWHMRGVRPKAQRAAQDAARRSGMSVGDWLDNVVLNAADGRGTPAQQAQPPDVPRHDAQPDPRHYEPPQPAYQPPPPAANPHGAARTDRPLPVDQTHPYYPRGAQYLPPPLHRPGNGRPPSIEEGYAARA